MRRVCHRMFQNVPSTQLKFAWKHNWHYELWSRQSDEKAHCSFKLLKFSFFYVMYFLALILIALLPKGKKNKWHVGTTHGFAGFGLSKTVYFSGGEKKIHCLLQLFNQSSWTAAGQKESDPELQQNQPRPHLRPLLVIGQLLEIEMGPSLGRAANSQKQSPLYIFFLHTWLVCFERLELRWRTMCLYQACLLLVST